MGGRSKRKLRKEAVNISLKMVSEGFIQCLILLVERL